MKQDPRDLPVASVEAGSSDPVSQHGAGSGVNMPPAVFGIYGGYQIALSNGRGGKAGAGHNKTATIQVRKPLRPGEYLLKAQFRFDVASSKSKANAHAKARAWIDAQRDDSATS